MKLETIVGSDKLISHTNLLTLVSMFSLAALGSVREKKIKFSISVIAGDDGAG